MKALAIRRVMKRAKPVFRKQDANKRKKLSRTSYRKPDGYSSGQRKRKRGKVAIPLVGFSSPRAVKGLHASGKKVVMVKNFKDLKLVDKESIGVISASVGMRKRLELLKSKVNFSISAESFAKKVEFFLKDRKIARDELMKSRERKAKLKKEEKKEEKSEEKKTGEELEVLEGTNKPAKPPKGSDLK